jgi:hypothetical protein
LSYLEVLRDDVPFGSTAAVIGASGIGFDVGEFLTHTAGEHASDVDNFHAERGIVDRWPAVDRPAALENARCRGRRW